MTKSDRYEAATRACRLHYLTAIQELHDISAQNSEPYTATRALVYTTTLDYLLDESDWWRQTRPTLPEIANCVVTEVLPDTGPEGIDNLVRYATEVLEERLVREAL